jgi:hypothetical protein
MRVKSSGLPKSQRFCTSKSALKRAFGDIQELDATMGTPFTAFNFDSRCSHRPKLTGPVVSSVAVHRDKTVHAIAYPISASTYTAEAASEFEERILPRMRAWVLEQLAKPQTGVLGVEEMIVEWTGKTHCEHYLRFL